MEPKFKGEQIAELEALLARLRADLAEATRLTDESRKDLASDGFSTKPVDDG